MSTFIKPSAGDSSHPKSSENRSPSPPPYSPLTPEHTMPAPDFLIGERTQVPSQVSRLPAPTPISESTETDVIALRSALSVLQLQRLRSVRDVQTLNRQKKVALANPEAFARGLNEGQIHGESHRDVLGVLGDEQALADDDANQSDGSNSGMETDISKVEERFGRIPQAQNVVRCPSINWAKYRVVGEVLDTLHNQQTQAPTTSSVQKEPTSNGQHLVAAPYSPWRDKLPNGVGKSQTNQEERTA